MFYYYFPAKVSVMSQELIGHILDNITLYKSYYAGGSLCIDNPTPMLNDVLVLNLDETFFGFNEGVKQLLSIDNIKKLFSVYKDHKGETDYYLEKFEKSCIKHLVN